MSQVAHRVRAIVRLLAVSGGIAMLGSLGAAPASATTAPCGGSSPAPVPTSTWKFAPRPDPTPQPKHMAKGLHAGCAPMMKSVRSVKPSGVGVPPPGTVNGHG